MNKHLKKFNIFFEKLLLLFIFLFPWQTIYIWSEFFVDGEKHQWGTVGIYGTQIIFWLAIICYVVDIILNKKIKDNRGQKKHVLPVLFFILYCFISGLWSVDIGIAFQHCIYILQAFMLGHIIVSEKICLKKMVFWFILGAFFQSILGITQFILQYSFENKWFGLVSHPVFESGVSVVQYSYGRFLRSYGAFSHPNVFGGFMFVASSISILAYRKWKKNWYVFVLFFEMIALFLSFSRSAWLAFIICLFIFIFIYRKTLFEFRKIFLVISIPVLFLSIFLFPLVQTRIIGNSMYEVQSITYRMSGYAEVIDILRGHLLFGTGIGNYTFLLMNNSMDMSVYAYQPVHNTFFLFFVELGLIGSILFLFFLYKLYRISNISNIVLIFLLLPMGLIACVDHYLFSSYSGIVMCTVYIFFAYYLTKKDIQGKVK
jgi:O-antigen ligase